MKRLNIDKKRTIRVLCVIGVLVLGSIGLWKLTGVIVKRSYSSEDVIVSNGLVGITTEDGGSTTTEELIYVDKNDLQEDSMTSTVNDLSVSSVGAENFQEEAKRLKKASQPSSNVLFTGVDDEGFTLEVSSVSGLFKYSGSKLDIFKQLVYEELRGDDVLGSNISNYTYSIGYYESNYVLYLKYNNDESTNGNDMYVVSDAGGYPKMYCRFVNFSNTEKKHFEDKGYKHYQVGNEYMYSY